MTKISYVFSYICTVILFCAFFMFLSDLAWFGRISKFEPIWDSVCPISFDNRYLVCMAGYDIVCIVIILLLLIYAMICLFRSYGWKIVAIPFLGFVLFLLACASFFGFV